MSRGGGCASPTPTASPTATFTPTVHQLRRDGNVYSDSDSDGNSYLTPTATATATATATGTPSPTPTCIPGGTPGPWATATPGPPARYRAGGCTDGTNIYVYGGGNSSGGYYNDLWRWNPATQAWTQLANMPTAKQNIQGAYWNGKIYVPGGFNGAHITENAIYDIATNAWSTGAPLPAAQTGTTVAFNNKVYNFGGNPGPQATVTIYDIATNTWTTGAAMPVATTYGRSIVAGSFAYYTGGITTVTTNAVYRYNFAANTWATMTPLQTARTSEELMTSPDNSKLFAVMGGDATFFTGVPLPVSVEIYDIAANTWTYGNPVVTKAAGPSGGLAGGKLMVQGGVDNTTYYNLVQVSNLGVCPSPTPTGTPSSTPTATATAASPTPTCTPGNQYTIAQIGGSIVPGTTDIGNHGDDTVTTIALPFAYTLYDQSFTSINLSSNGNAQFMTTDTTFTNQCLPWLTHNYTIFPYWDDLYLVNSGFGIFTSVSGTAPNRIFNIEWRAQYFPGSGNASFELRLYEGQTRFDVIYGTVDNGNTSATAGVQKNDTVFTSTSAMAQVARLPAGKATRCKAVVRRHRHRRNGHSHGNAFTDAYLRARGHTRAMEHGQSVSDNERALRLRADRHALLCVRRSVQWHASAQRQPLDIATGMWQSRAPCPLAVKRLRVR